MERHARQDRSDIEALIARETHAYFAKDFAAWADCWQHDLHARRWSWFPGIGFDFEHGWERMSAKMQAAMLRFPAPLPGNVRRENMEFVLGADMAMVTFDQYSDEFGDAVDKPGLQHEMRIVLKTGGLWKIVCISVLKPEEQSSTMPLIEVDAAAKVLWMNEAARGLLARHPVLRISAGRLRGDGTTNDRQLRQAIAWAAAHRSYIGAHVAQLAHRATSGALPLVLGEDETGVKSLCWVKATLAKILISFDDRGMADQRLAAAALVFGLSPGQSGLAARIIEGLELKSAAAAMNISVNTARTHLQRMFDKTGVHSQSALVRVLLSTLPLPG